jgi:hypothetical protein
MIVLKKVVRYHICLNSAWSIAGSKGVVEPEETASGIRMNVKSFEILSSREDIFDRKGDLGKKRGEDEN